MFEEAILVMDSRSESSSARSGLGGFDWTRLYKSKQWYLDLWLHHSSSGTTMVGQVIPEDPKQSLKGHISI